jgi:4'-phosphopantetheinyl transferase
VLSRPAPRVHLVTQAIVERTVARRGVAGLLTAVECDTLDTLSVERRRQDWLAGRLAAKRAVRAACRHAGQAPAYRSIEIWNSSDGAPGFTVESRPELSERLNISISHTDGAAIAAVAETNPSGSVGVDIEVTKPLSLTVVRRVLRSKEIARLDANADAHPSPLALWTAKEAVMKAAHQFCDALCDVELRWIGTRPRSAHVIGALASTRTIVVWHRELGPYTVAVALCR